MPISAWEKRAPKTKPPETFISGGPFVAQSDALA
jgi:hypothetical protein